MTRLPRRLLADVHTRVCAVPPNKPCRQACRTLDGHARGRDGQVDRVLGALELLGHVHAQRAHGRADVALQLRLRPRRGAQAPAPQLPRRQPQDARLRGSVAAVETERAGNDECAFTRLFPDTLLRATRFWCQHRLHEPSNVQRKVLAGRF